MPWNTQEKMSSREAVRRGSTLYSRDTSRAMSPATMMATVLLAVAQSQRETMAAMPTWADLLPFMTRRSFWMIQAMPPFLAISSDIPPHSRVRKNTSFMPVKPLHTLWAKEATVMSPLKMPTRPAEKMPMVRAKNTFMPHRASTSTSR